MGIGSCWEQVGIGDGNRYLQEHVLIITVSHRTFCGQIRLCQINFLLCLIKLNVYSVAYYTFLEWRDWGMWMGVYPSQLDIQIQALVTDPRLHMYFESNTHVDPSICSADWER
jgi:hypothetical protein